VTRLTKGVNFLQTPIPSDHNLTVSNVAKSALVTDVQDAFALAHVIVDSVREPLVVLDGEHRVVAASRSACLTFKVTRNEIRVANSLQSIAGIKREIVTRMERIAARQLALPGCPARPEDVCKAGLSVYPRAGAVSFGRFSARGDDGHGLLRR